MRLTKFVIAVATVAVLASLAACSSSLSPPGNVAAGTSRNAIRLRVVAAENFYGDLAKSVGGDLTDVTSILTSPSQDPHLFAPGTQLGLTVGQAAVVISNGAGYDDWMDKLIAAAPAAHRQLVKVADVLHVTEADANPHLWYDTPSLPQLVASIGAALTAADPGHADAYRAGVASTTAGLQPLLDAVHQLGVEHPNAAVAYTERVPGLLLAAAGLSVRTPPSFARAIEDGTDPSPADVSAMRQLLTGHMIKVLLYNEQATSPVTQQLQDLAKASGVPIVPVTETVPEGATFLSWQLAQVRALAQALSS